MIQRTKHTEPSTNSYAAAYGYAGLIGRAQASQGASRRRTLTELGSSSWITDDSGNACADRSRSISQHLQYLPFGKSRHPEPSRRIDQRTNHDIRFKFTTKEEDSETGYTYFGARYYDSDISVWLSVDPLSDKYPSMSPFMYTAGNPVMLVDPDGRKIDPAGDREEKAYNDFKTKVNNQVAAYDNKTSNLRNRGTKLSNWRANRRDKRRGRNEYVKIQTELTKLEDADEVFKIRMGSNVTSTEGAGNFVYNKDTKEFDVNICEIGDFSEMGKLSHELKHAYQYLDGKIGFDLKMSGKLAISFAYDLQDEFEAYARQSFFGSSLSEEQIRAKYKNLSENQITIKNSPYYKELKGVNRGYNSNNVPPKILYHGWKNDITP